MILGFQNTYLILFQILLFSKYLTFLDFSLSIFTSHFGTAIFFLFSLLLILFPQLYNEDNNKT